MEVRVLEEGPRDYPAAVQPNIPAQNSVDVNATTAGVPTEAHQPVTISTKAPEENVESAVCINLNAASSAVSSQSIQAGEGNDAEGGSSLITETELVLDHPTDAGIVALVL